MGGLREKTWKGGLVFLLCAGLSACSAPVKVYRLTKGTVKSAYRVTKGATDLSLWTGKTVYRVGGTTFRVARAPIGWALTHKAIQSIDGISPSEAIQQGRVKNSPYTVMGKTYYPMSVQEATRYKEIGMASWYGEETSRKKGGQMTANGEVFSPNNLTAAHKYLPLPTFARVTNLENRRSVIVRVNDRGPFIRGRIIDLTSGAARKLGFYKKGTAKVLVETVEVD
jgi:rare lipoprotein A